MVQWSSMFLLAAALLLVPMADALLEQTEHHPPIAAAENPAEDTLRVSLRINDGGIEVAKPVLLVRSGKQAEVTLGPEDARWHIRVVVKPHESTDDAYVSRVRVEHGDAVVFDGALLSNEGQRATIEAKDDAQDFALDLIVHRHE